MACKLIVHRTYNTVLEILPITVHEGSQVVSNPVFLTIIISDADDDDPTLVAHKNNTHRLNLVDSKYLANEVTITMGEYMGIAYA